MSGQAPSGSQVPVTVIIPTRNRAERLLRAIQSVLNQTWNLLEVIVVDDASEDHTREVLEKIQDSRILTFRHETPKGGSAARNTGIKHASGAYLSFLDDDDYFLPEKLERQLETFQSCGESVGVMYAGYRREVEHARSGRDILPRHQGDLFQKLLFENFIAPPTVLIRKICIDTVGGFDESLSSCQDWDLWLRLSAEYHFSSVDRVLAVVVSHGDQISYRADVKIQGLSRFLEKHQDSYRQYPEPHAHILRYLGVLQCFTGMAARGRASFKASLRLRPANMKVYMHYLLSYLPSGTYRAVVNAVNRWTRQPPIR